MKNYEIIKSIFCLSIDTYTSSSLVFPRKDRIFFRCDPQQSLLPLFPFLFIEFQTMKDIFGNVSYILDIYGINKCLASASSSKFDVKMKAETNVHLKEAFFPPKSLSKQNMF